MTSENVTLLILDPTLEMTLFFLGFSVRLVPFKRDRAQVDGAHTLNLLNDVKATCQLLSMSRSALYEALKQGRIAAVKNGSRTLFHRSEIERFASNLTRS